MSKGTDTIDCRGIIQHLLQASSKPTLFSLSGRTVADSMTRVQGGNHDSTTDTVNGGNACELLWLWLYNEARSSPKTFPCPKFQHLFSLDQKFLRVSHTLLHFIFLTPLRCDEVKWLPQGCKARMERDESQILIFQVHIQGSHH